MYVAQNLLSADQRFLVFPSSAQNIIDDICLTKHMTRGVNAASEVESGENGEAEPPHKERRLHEVLEGRSGLYDTVGCICINSKGASPAAIIVGHI